MAGMALGPAGKLIGVAKEASKLRGAARAWRHAARMRAFMWTLMAIITVPIYFFCVLE